MSNFGNMILDNKAQNILIRSSIFLITRFMNKRLDKKQGIWAKRYSPNRQARTFKSQGKFFFV